LSDRPSHLAHRAGGLCRAVSDCGTKLATPPRFAAVVDNGLPARLTVDPAVDDEELQNVLQARPKALSTDR